MPTVRKFSRQTQTAALPGVRLQAAETARSRGAEAGGAATAEALGRLGGVGASIGIGEYTRLRKEAKVEADDTAHYNGVNQINAYVTTDVQAALSTSGQAAFDQDTVVRAGYGKVVASVMEGMTPDQRRRFEPYAAERGFGIEMSMQRHIAGERHTYTTNVLKGTVASGTALAAFHAQDDTAVAKIRTDTEQALRTLGPQVGLTGEVLEQAVDDFHQGTSVSVVQSLLTSGKDQLARKAFDDAQASAHPITGDALIQVQKQLETGSTEGEAARAADAIWASQGKVSPNELVSVDTLTELAHDQVQDPKTQELTRQKLQARVAEHNAGVQTRATKNESTVVTAWVKGAKLEDLTAMPEYRALPGPKQDEIRRAIVDRAYTDYQRARGYTYDQYQDLQLRESKLNLNGWKGYWDHSKAEDLVTMTEDQVTALAPTLGIEHTNRLLEKWRALQTRGALPAATIDETLFKAIAQRAGLSPYGTGQSDTAKAQLGSLQNEVETEIARAQQGGKVLSRAEKEKLMQQVIDQRVMTSTWYGGTSAAIAATVVNAKDQARAYVPWEQIPERSKAELIYAVRNIIPNAQALSEADLIARYKDQMQRAHAANVMHLGEGEALARIRAGAGVGAQPAGPLPPAPRVVGAR